MTTAYDVEVATAEEMAARRVGKPAALFAGWAGPEGPAIEEWPRSPRTGQPLVHCFTLWLPEEYRRKGPEHVAVSVFQWDDARSHEFPFIPYGPSGALIVGHPDANVYVALLWLTQEQLTGPRSTRPANPAPLDDDEHDPAVRGARRRQAGALWLVPRDDPNAGVAPVDMPDEHEQYRDLADRYDRFGMQHLGGTLMNPDGPGLFALSPWYLEVNGLGGFDFAGGDDLALDLDAPFPLGRDLMVDVVFDELAEWESTRERDGGAGPTRRVYVWIAFDRRLVSTGEQDGPSWHAGVFTPTEALGSFPHFFRDDASAWLQPFVERLAAGEDSATVQDDARRAYAGRHGGSPPATRTWPLAARNLLRR